MIKLIFVFLVVYCLVHVGITVFRNLTGREKWELTKLIGYSIVVSVISLAILTSIVVLF